ncbi:hypothetical protein Q2V57_23365 [Enterobacter bugandensis]|uniref:hypothetical protein n=1 Tax=Enterobacter TaxID=547 RepID=UPI0018878BB1|nr:MULTISPECIES: hypothetical protein [Enterobacter]MBF2792956.1 hypothetical protein [Enterobacter asburiae]MDO2434478.1 hypothetical protein [Enterobacter bugandensis]MDO2447510.1 hypothetical protein [Enterobacter bugandensis]HBH9258388.1 hypothetical protein [Escherichia coli]
MKLSLFFISVITFLLAISPIAYSGNTIIPDRIYDPYLNSAVTPDGNVYDRLTGRVLKVSDHPQPNFGFPVQSSSDSCDTTYVKARTEDGRFLVTSDGVTILIADNVVDVVHWQPNDELRICGDRVINIDDNTSSSFTYN